MEQNRILVVEDECIVAEDLKHSLDTMGYEVVDVVSKGESAIHQAGQLLPDIILMDIFLQDEVTGIDAASRIFETYDIPVIFTTANSDHDIVEKAKQAHPYGFIIKPFDESTLHGSIEMALHNHRLKRQLQESEAFYSSLFQHSPMQTIVVDRSGKIVRFNLAKEMSGDRLPRIGDVMYRDYAANHALNMHTELMKCMETQSQGVFTGLHYGEKTLNVNISPFDFGAVITAQREQKSNENSLLKMMMQSPFIGCFVFQLNPSVSVNQTPDRIQSDILERAILVNANEACQTILGLKKNDIQLSKLPFANALNALIHSGFASSHFTFSNQKDDFHVSWMGHIQNQMLSQISGCISRDKNVDKSG